LIHRVSLAIADEGAQLSRLVDSLKERASSESFRMEWSETQIDPATMIEEAVGTLRSVAARRDIDIRCKAPSGLSPVWAHRERFIHALVLLIDSAITHAPEGGCVEVEVMRSGPEVIFRIHQRGGEVLSADAIEEILAGDPHRTGALQAGFAFKLSREIITNHRGRFWIDRDSATGMTSYVALSAVRYERRAASYDEDTAPAAYV
jgi:signal transduction histidine kinase